MFEDSGVQAECVGDMHKNRRYISGVVMSVVLAVNLAGNRKINRLPKMPITSKDNRGPQQVAALFAGGKLHGQPGSE